MQMPPWITKLTQKQIKYIVFVFVLYSVECLSKKDLQFASFQFISAVYQLFWNPGCARSRTDTAHLSVSENVFSDFYPCETQFEDYTFRARTFFFFFPNKLRTFWLVLATSRGSFTEGWTPLMSEALKLGRWQKGLGRKMWRDSTRDRSRTG